MASGKMNFVALAIVLTLCFLSSCASGEDAFTIGAFNIQILGQSKAAKPEVMAILAQIVQRYDIVLVQEIRDSSGTAIESLVTKANEEGPHEYGKVLSDRLGRTSSKEQYAFLYRMNSGIKVEGDHQFSDPHDVFEREPLSVLFKSEKTAVSEFALMAIHTKPSDAVNETNHLDSVHDEIALIWNTDNILIMGDFNADCSYINNKEKKELVLKTDPKYHWWIPDDVDTTVGNTDCAYDRFVMTGKPFIDAVVDGSAKVFRFDEEYGLDDNMAEDVSDHYPIELQLASKTDGTSGQAGIHGNAAAHLSIFTVIPVFLKATSIFLTYVS